MMKPWARWAGIAALVFFAYLIGTQHASTSMPVTVEPAASVPVVVRVPAAPRVACTCVIGEVARETEKAVMASVSCNGFEVADEQWLPKSALTGGRVADWLVAKNGWGCG